MFWSRSTRTVLLSSLAIGALAFPAVAQTTTQQPAQTQAQLQFSQEGLTPAQDRFYITFAPSVSFITPIGLRSASGISTSLGDLGTLSNRYTFNVDTALGANVSVGYRFRSPFRVEAEFSYIGATIGRIDASPVDPAPLFPNAPLQPGRSGNLNFYGGLLSLYYDIDTGSKFRVFVGGGGGIGSYSFDNVELLPNVRVNGSSSTFIYQGRVGASYAFSPDFAISLGYRYLGGSGFSVPLRGTNTFVVNGPPTAEQLQFEVGGTTINQVELGLRAAF